MKIFIDPPYKDYHRNELFNVENSFLNRDGTLLPFHRLKEKAEVLTVPIMTADYIPDFGGPGDFYYSLGVLPNINLLHEKKIKMKSLVILEPPLIASSMYKSLNNMIKEFECVYLHNNECDGYMIDSSLMCKVRKLYWPLPYCGVLNKFWKQQSRQKRIVVINGHHRPKTHYNELYSKRIDTMVELSRFNMVDLYGNGWDKFISVNSIWWPYLKNIRCLMSIYHGSCPSKYEVLSRYHFSLCFENMRMKGYISEKIFDCFYAGTIPIYFGAEDVTKYIPSNAFIDFRQYDSVEKLANHVENMSLDEMNHMRKVAYDFLTSDCYSLNYFQSLENIFSIT